MHFVIVTLMLVDQFLYATLGNVQNCIMKNAKYHSILEQKNLFYRKEN